ncbi:hypothetical protein X963_3127 [Burkholderia pseudomallei MSHR7498]|uniref:hypothetical protein n=1 Tax=Burkholderia pseudomallei TaxID=28450 RepID=UPI000531585D|nr:hypothetical protein [Burkholderia pseudomallei]KGS95294.1 hypothetical protein X963_3127 [Burkholderia pseudomallei MSHR7498]
MTRAGAAGRADGQARRRGFGRTGRGYRRFGGGALALTVVAAIHGLAWLAIERWALPAGTAAAPDAPRPARRALVVTLIPRSVSAPPSASTAVSTARSRLPSPLLLSAPASAPMTARARPSARRGPAPRASMGSVHVAAREREPSSRRAPGIPAVSEPLREPRSDAQASAEAGDAQRRLPRAPGVAADWRADLDSLGAARPIRQAAATAAIGAMGASSGVTPARAETATSTLARTMSKASRADCRNAHSGMGLLAIPALALDAVTDTGCKW